MNINFNFEKEFTPNFLIFRCVKFINTNKIRLMRKTLLFILILTFPFRFCYSEVIKLKNGKIIKAKIIERTDKYLTIDSYGTFLNYDFDEIETIAKEQSVPALVNKKIDLEVNFSESDLGIAFWLAVVEKNPHDSVAYYNLGQSYASLRKYEQAINYFKKTIQINPDFAKAYFDLGHLYNYLEKHEQAIYYLKKAIENNPSFAKAYNNLGLAYIGLGRFSESLLYCRKAIQLDSNYTDAYSNLGYIYIALGQYEQGIAYILEALRRNPENATSYANLGVAYFSLGRYKESQENFQNARDLYQNSEHYQNIQEVEKFLEQLQNLNLDK